MKIDTRLQEESSIIIIEVEQLDGCVREEYCS